MIRVFWILVATSMISIAFAAQGAPPTAGCLAAKCHGELAVGASVHGPVRAKGGCGVCHESAAGPRGSLPKDHAFFAKLDPHAATESCLGCHDGMKSIYGNRDRVHAPVLKDGCTKCHDPHRSSHPKLLKNAPATVACVGCHEAQGKELEPRFADMPGANHSKEVGKDSCLKCHGAHGSEHQHDLKSGDPELCLSCHDKAISGHDGKIFASMKAWKDKPSLRHGYERKEGSEPVRCGSCHTIHNRTNRALLVGTYTEKFRAPFEARNFELCARCHRDAFASTGFRNGERNLHLLHVQSGKKGRTCRACHDPHVGGAKSLIHEWMPFGEFRVPFRFEKNAEGGTCATACHSQMRYSRTREVSNEARK